MKFKRDHVRELFFACDDAGRIYDVRLIRQELEDEIKAWSWKPTIYAVMVPISLGSRFEDLYMSEETERLTRSVFLNENVNPLFSERVPEAAAVQLALVLAWATECQLATLEELKARKSASQRDIRRHASIAAKLVFNCKDLNVTPRVFCGRPCPRLTEYLERPKEELAAWERQING